MLARLTRNRATTASGRICFWRNKASPSAEPSQNHNGWCKLRSPALFDQPDRRERIAVKFRHAAALALAGWYLILPPLTPNGRWIDTTAPLSAWYKVKPPYASKDGCERAKNGMIALHRANPSSPSKLLSLKDEQAGLCVHSDDPRLYAN